MKSFQSNLLARFSVVSFVIITVIAVAIGSLLTDRLNGEIDLLKKHGDAMLPGELMEMSDPYSIPSLTANVRQLKWLTGGALGVGFLVLYGGLLSIVWRGYRTIHI